MFDPQVNIVGSNKGVQSTIERLASKAKRLQENYLSDDIMDAVLQKIRKIGQPTETHINTKNMGKEMKDRIKILEKLVKVDANKVVTKVGEEVVSVLYQIHSELQNLFNSEQMRMAMESANQNITFSFNNQFTSVTDGFRELSKILKIAKLGVAGLCLYCISGCPTIDPFLPLICGQGLRDLLNELIRLLDCLAGYDEAAFEDGTEWLYCIYDCRYEYSFVLSWNSG